jgi:cytochrome P450
MISFEPLRDGARQDPYPLYRALRDEAGVYRAPESGHYCVSRYEDVQQVLRSPGQFSSRAMLTVLQPRSFEGGLPVTPLTLWYSARMMWKARLNPFRLMQTPSLIACDGPRHDALRAIVSRGFTPRRIAAWEKRAREVVADCLARVEGRESFDLVEELAVRLPVTVIADMLGVPSERLHDFKRWSDMVIQTSTGPLRDDALSPRALQTLEEAIVYLSEVARERRRAPQDDLVSEIVSEREGEALHPQDAMMFVLLLLVAGNETTTNLIGNAANALLDHPDQLALLAADPARIPAAIEEAVRFDSPVQLVFRTATEDARIADTTIPKGATVAALIASANRDERRFPEADRFDIARNPQGHLGFGLGKHFCLGASLARLEARVALEALVPRLLTLRKREAQPVRLDSFLVRGPARLVVEAAAHRSAAAA